MGKRKVNYSRKGISNLPENKPVLYRIKTAGGNVNYAGIAKRGRVQDRIEEHLSEIPGSTVEIEQFNRIADAIQKEGNVIKRTQPKYNEQGK